MTVLETQLWSAISPLLDQALEMSQPERESWLNEMEQTSARVLAKIVRGRY